MSAPPTITALLVLGRCAYAVSGSEVIPLSTAEDGLTPQQALDRWLDDQTPKVRSAIPIVWEPTGDHAMLHDRIELPHGTPRTEFASAEEVLKKFPAIAHGSHAWSYEPVPKGIVTGKIFVHIESVPELQLFGETAVAQGILISAAWSLPSVAFNGFGRGIGVKVLALAPGFCGVYTVPANGGPTRGMVSVVGTADPHAARSLYPVLEKEGFFASDQAPKGWRIVGTKDELLALGRLLAEGVEDPKIEGFVESVAITAPIKTWAAFISENTKRLPRGAEQDLWATFPQPFPLGKVLRVATVVCIAVAVFFCIEAGNALKTHKTTAIVNINARRAKEKQLETARADQAIFAQYKTDTTGKNGGADNVVPRGRAALLQVLHEKVVESYTLTSLIVGSDGAIAAEFFQVVDGPDMPPELANLRSDLQRAGFGNCTIQPVTASPDRDSGPGLATKRRYRMSAQYTPST